MKERKTYQKNFYLFDELDETNGSICSRKFFSNICEYTIRYLKKYFKHMKKKKAFIEHGFIYREQQIKSYITPAINEATESCFMQEYSIERKPKKKGHKEREISSGRIDYWAHFGNCSFLIELKHAWIRYFPKENKISKDYQDFFTFYKSTKNRLKSATKQIKRIKYKSDYKYEKNLYSFPLVISPIYVDEDMGKNLNKGEIPRPLKISIKNALRIGIKKEMRANIFGLWILPKKYLYYDPYKNRSNIKKQEYFPALCFIGKIKKI